MISIQEEQCSNGDRKQNHVALELIVILEAEKVLFYWATETLKEIINEKLGFEWALQS